MPESNTRIEKSDWLNGVFGKSHGFTDILREPAPQFTELSKSEQNKLRQTQIFEDEVIRILGHAGESPKDFSLVMKFDGVVGWLPKHSYIAVSEINEFQQPRFTQMKSLEFLEAWKGTPYLWGGLSKKGVDCSGLTQLYFLNVRGKLIPKNSRDQRKFGVPKILDRIQNDDLIFGKRIFVNGGGNGIHHVGLFLDGNIWHARSEGGIVCQDFNEFVSQFDIEAVVQINPGS
jgi:hypothetical protein